MSQTNADVVVDKAGSSWSDLWTKEDYWAIWLGLIFVFLGLYLYVFSYPAADKAASMEKIKAADVIMTAELNKATFKTVAWYDAQASKKVKFKASAFGAELKNIMKGPARWSTNPMQAFVLDQATADARNEKAKPAAEAAKKKSAEARAAALEAEKAAEAASFKDEALNKAADAKVTEWRDALRVEGKAVAKTKVKPFNILTTLPIMLVALGVILPLWDKAFPSS